MKYKTLFRLLVKAVGVWLIAVNGPQAFLRIFNLTLGWLLDSGQPPLLSWPFLLWPISNLISAGIGFYLFFGGEWVVNKAIPGNRPYCPECGYDLSGSTGNRCVECGTPFRREDIEPPAATMNDENNNNDVSSDTKL